MDWERWLIAFGDMWKNKKVQFIGVVIITLILVMLTSLSINKLHSDRKNVITEAMVVDRWVKKWEECEVTPETKVEIHTKEFIFQCPRESAISDKATSKDRKWRCKVVLNCEWADWSVSDPQDYCTYEFQNHVSEENPQKEIANVPYGGWCVEIK